MSAVMVMVGMQAYGQYQQGVNARRSANNQALQSDYLAELEHDAGVAQAKIIRREGRRAIGSATAAYAGAGVKVDQGSAAEVQREMQMNVEKDAFQAILEGDRRGRGYQVDSVMARTSGDLAQAAGVVNAVTTMAGGAYSGLRASGWRSKGPGFSGTQSAAPVVDLSTRG